MKLPRTAIIATVIAVAAILGLQPIGLAQPTSNLRVIAPPNGAKFKTDFVEIRYELINPAIAASTSPRYKLQLDGQSPVYTHSTDYTFTGLAPGLHTVVIQVVDANGVPIYNAANAVQFTVLPDAGIATPSGEVLHSPPLRAPELRNAALQKLHTVRRNTDKLPNAGSALPLLSIIGFGVLLGGIASALRTR